MIHFFNTQFEALSIHKIGNQHKNEGLSLSSEPYALDDELNGHLKEFFFKPFRKKRRYTTISPMRWIWNFTPYTKL